MGIFLKWNGCVSGSAEATILHNPIGESIVFLARLQSRPDIGSAIVGSALGTVVRLQPLRSEFFTALDRQDRRHQKATVRRRTITARVRDPTKAVRLIRTRRADRRMLPHLEP